MKLARPALAYLLSAICGLPAAQATVRRLATYKGPGGIDGALIGPGPTAGSERLYLAYMYVNRTVDLVSVDPANGKWRVFQNPSKTEYGAVAILGPDGDIYLGTRPHAHIFQLNPRTGQYKDLGQPAPGEAYLWQLAVASDGKIYACTYPSAKLVRYDPASGKLEDLGRMDPKQEYGLSIAASTDGFVYEGIGTEQAHLVAYQISTGKFRDILPPAAVSGSERTGENGHTAKVHKGDDGKIYAVAGGRDFLVKDWTTRQIPASEVRPPASTMLLSDGRSISVNGNQIILHGPGATRTWVPYSYPGREGDVFRLAAGPDGRIYGSSILPFHLFTLNLRTDQLEDIGALGHGEAYSMALFERKLFLGVYGGMDGAPLMIYDPARRFHPGISPGSNPVLKTYAGADIGWRPKAMVLGPRQIFFIGSVAGYGSVDGPLTTFNPRTTQVMKFQDVVPGESVVSLATAGNLIVGGTSIYGGGGSHPTQTEAKLITWDPNYNKTIYETTPVSDASSITDILALSGCKVMGIATGVQAANTGSAANPGATLFVEDVCSRKLDYAIPFGLKGIIFNSVAQGPDRAIWGLVRDGIFRFDPTSRRIQLIARTPKPVTAGFALVHSGIYYASGPDVYRYTLPDSGE